MARSKLSDSDISNVTGKRVIAMGKIPKKETLKQLVDRVHNWALKQCKLDRVRLTENYMRGAIDGAVSPDKRELFAQAFAIWKKKYGVTPEAPARRRRRRKRTS